MFSLVAEVKVEIVKFEGRFKALKKLTREGLERRGESASLRVVVERLTDLSVDDQPDHILFLKENMHTMFKAADHHELFGTLNFYWDYLSYHLLHHLVIDFSVTEVLDDMHAYETDLSRFRSSTPLKLFAEAQKRRHIQLTDGFKKVAIHFNWSENATLEDVENFRSEFAFHYKLRECAMMLFKIYMASVHVTWLIPESLVQILMMSIPVMLLQQFNVISLEVADTLVYEHQAQEQRLSVVHHTERFFELKRIPQYTEGKRQSQISSDVHQLQQEPQEQRIMTDAKMREASEYLAQITELQVMVEESHRMIDIKDREIQESQQTLSIKQHTLETKERELHETQEQLRVSEQLVSQFQHSLQQKDKIISDFQQTRTVLERNVQRLQQQDKANRAQPQLKAVDTITTQTTVAAYQKNIYKGVWREGKNVPERMKRGAAVVHGNTAYIRPANSRKVFSYWNVQGNEQYYQLPKNHNKDCGLAVIDGLLTSVGGCNNAYTNTLLSLTGECAKKLWLEVFPPMPTSRSCVACITTEQALVVAGGVGNEGFLDNVEVMDINTKQWIAVCPLPQSLSLFTSIACGDTLYLAGGLTETSSKSVFTCSLTDLWQPEAHDRKQIWREAPRSVSRHAKFSVWKEISTLPVSRSTPALFGGHILTIGGRDDSGNSTTDVYRYDSVTDSWNVVSQMKNRRSHCFAFTLPHDRLIILGGL